ncbi:wall-associated receptor kinase-like 6 isoform X1 [Helianthus annuus]|uniref:wall-associated receptor kinase-like 6 isoform X1 n=1 Tax=Helianthus annuus TaxID=4232 RepID=UPI000B8EFF0C|nr:wall-associated receptor kinase-like 6 isoform X1 [Helianthus annuus]
MKQFQVLYTLILILISTEAIEYAKNGCRDACGNMVTIPYPFGIGADCSANKWYVVDCISSRPYLSAFKNMEVLEVNLEEQKVIVNVSVISRCQNSVAISNHTPGIDLGESPFLFSGSDNMLIFEGCGYAGLLGDGEVCPACSNTCTNYNTDRFGGCQLKICGNLKSYSIDVDDFTKGSGGDESCGSAFMGITPVVLDTIWRSGYEYLNTRNPSYYPISLLWFLTKDDIHHGLHNCWEPKNNESSLHLAHLRKCSCGEGRVGNPYLQNQCEVSTEALSLVKKGCQERCGEVGIPFPFGIGEHCALDKRYVVDCNSSIPYLSAFKNMEVMNVSLEQQTITVNASMNLDFQKQVINSSEILPSTIDFDDSGSPFLFSRLHNIFVVVGCGNAVITDVEGATVTGCTTTCTNDTFVDLKNCCGIGCCQATIPYYLENFTLNLTQLEKQGGDETRGFSFLVDKDSFVNRNFSLQSIGREHYYVPISLYWPLTFLYEEDIPAFERPECTDLAFRLHDGSLVGYRKCQCNISQEGNPYLPKGCRKLKECIECERKGGVCSRVFSSIYDDVTSQIISKLSCDMHYGRKSSLGVILGVSISMGLVLLIASIYTLYKKINKVIVKRQKEKYFKRNGGLLLKQQQEIDAGLIDKTILFTSKDLEMATDNYNENRILGRGGQGTVYKGMLADGRIVAVKKSKIVDENQLDQFINEVVILSQVNHRNVVKLLGCCLETEVPQLVSEFVPNGTLYSLIQDDTGEFPFSLNTRLQIATEVAGALSYLHSATSIPIYHRDIKTTNILLDEKYRAKVSDFGTSRFVSIDQTHVTTLVKGTFGYLDPQYFQSSQFTEKSDVYSFGVVLLELFTREKPISLTKFGEHRNLATYFMFAMKEGRVMSIFDQAVVKEDSKGVLLTIANLAMRCLNTNGKQRPSMKEVAMELEGIRTSHVPSTSTVQTSFGWANHNEDPLVFTYSESASTSTSFKDTIH